MMSSDHIKGTVHGTTGGSIENFALARARELGLVEEGDTVVICLGLGKSSALKLRTIGDRFDMEQQMSMALSSMARVGTVGDLQLPSANGNDSNSRTRNNSSGSLGEQEVRLERILPNGHGKVTSTSRQAVD